MAPMREPPRSSGTWWHPSSALPALGRPRSNRSPDATERRPPPRTRRRQSAIPLRSPHGDLRLALLLDRLGDLQRLLDQRLDDGVLRDGLDHLAADEDLTLTVARRHAEISLTGLPRAVDDA